MILTVLQYVLLYFLSGVVFTFVVAATGLDDFTDRYDAWMNILLWPIGIVFYFVGSLIRLVLLLGRFIGALVDKFHILHHLDPARVALAITPEARAQRKMERAEKREDLPDFDWS